MEEKEKNTVNQNILILIGMILIIVVIASIATYAYVTWRGKDTSGGLTTTIGDLATITFDDGVNINSNTLTPVLNYQDGIYSTFSIAKKVDTEVYAKFYLIINKIDVELQNEALKFILLESDDNNSFEIISTGDFSTIENGELTLLEDYEIDTIKTYYKLYIYIDGREDNTNMTNKELDVILSVGANKEKTKNNVITSDTITSDIVTSDTTTSDTTTSDIITSDTSIIQE